ncbi:uncharacterized protein ARMOST_02306 [Armillaria ostoyae]|uniref:Uncharacterized protein n=1 Tax=Armillaria ostoyae TaxID=47428 RepID=A0A284QRD5_ARMOS|nr:uncharacterized protein ARMOST_02306 [Armillaria ostoyae]
MLNRSRSNYPPGLSKGSIVTIGLAVKYPYKIASLFFVSPLGLKELVSATPIAPPMAGGQYKSIEDFGTGQPNMEVLSDSFYCVLQLCFNNNLDGLANALATIIHFPLKNHVPERFDQFEIAAVNVLNDRKEYTNDQLARVPHPCP